VTETATLCAHDASGICPHCGHKARARPHYRACPAFAQPVPTTMPGQSRPEPPPSHGPGTELKKLLSRIGIKASPTCTCNARAREMDAWGIDEASKPERIEQAVGWLREEAQKRGLPFLDAAGRMLIKRAISNARRASREQKEGAATV